MSVIIAYWKQHLESKYQSASAPSICRGQKGKSTKNTEETRTSSDQRRSPQSDAHRVAPTTLRSRYVPLRAAGAILEGPQSEVLNAKQRFIGVRE